MKARKLSPNDPREGRRWCVMDLVTDHTSGKLRESYCWSNAGKALTFALIVEFRHYLIEHWETLLILIGVIVFPKLIENVGTMIAQARFGHGAMPPTTTEFK